MELDELNRWHGKALAWATEQVWAVPPGAFQNQSPCTDWLVRDVVDHLVSENLWAEHILAGATVDEVGDRFEGDLLGDDPRAAWREAAERCASAFNQPGVLEQIVHLSFGDHPARLYAEQMTGDLIIHGWDIARGAGIDATIPAALVEVASDVFLPHVEAARELGIFEPPVELTNDATPQVRLLAATGRSA